VTPHSASAPRGLSVVQINSIVVPIDGTEHSERAVPVACSLGDRFDAPVRLLGVTKPGGPDDEMRRRVADVAERSGAEGWSVVSADDPADPIVVTLGLGNRVLGCMASHGRDRSAVALGSVTRQVLAQMQAPVVVVGPAVSAPLELRQPVVVAVSGRTDDDDVAEVGAAWATGLGTRLVLVTVVEPAMPPVRVGARDRRARGPGQPGAYLAELAAPIEGPPEGIATEIVEDPVSVRDGLRPWLPSVRPALVVAGWHRDHRVRHFVVGDHASQLVHDAPCPVVLVPLGFSR
jgi:nucleotide-binding universal stress UspA family protein